MMTLNKKHVGGSLVDNTPISGEGLRAGPRG